MLPYIILFVTSLLGVVQYDINRHNRTKKIAWYFLFCYVILLVGLRYRVGSDTLVYIWGYDRLPSWGELNWSEIWSYEFQPLYVLLCAIAKSISPDFTVLQILHAFIINSCIFYFIRKNTQYPFTGLFLYFFLYFFYFNTEILRESLAIGIFLLNYKNLENKRWLRFYCGVFVSVLFHFSALILVFFPFIRLIKFNWKYLLVISLFCAFLISMRSYLSVLDTLDALNARKIAHYSSQFEDGAMNAKWILYRVMQYTFFPILLLWLQKFCIKEQNQWVSFVCVYALLGIGVIVFQIIFARFTNYLMPFYALFLADIIGRGYGKSPSRKLFSTLSFACIMIIYGYYYISGDNWHIWNPYHSVFDPQTDEIREHRLDDYY